MPTKKAVAISSEVEAVLRRAEVSGDRLVIRERLDRSMYEAVNKVLVALGGKWNRSAGAHVFSRPVAEVLSDALDAGEAVDEKKTFDVYETPPDVARQMIELAGTLPASPRILEPSAGSGNLVRAARSAYPSAEIVACEIRTCPIDGDPNVIHRGDFLDRSPGALGTFDLILANPPFSNGLDARHVLHMLKFARPAAPSRPRTRLVTIVSPAYTFRSTKEMVELRERIEEAQYLAPDRTVVRELSAGTFSGEGTDIRTHLIAMDV